MKITIKITHKGEDYYGVEVNGEYKEVTLSEGEAIKNLIKTLKLLTL